MVKEKRKKKKKLLRTIYKTRGFMGIFVSLNNNKYTIFINIIACTWYNAFKLDIINFKHSKTWRLALVAICGKIPFFAGSDTFTLTAKLIMEQTPLHVVKRKEFIRKRSIHYQ